MLSLELTRNHQNTELRRRATIDSRTDTTAAPAALPTEHVGWADVAKQRENAQTARRARAVSEPSERKIPEKNAGA